MKRIVSFIAAFGFFSLVTQAQRVTGIVKDETGKGLDKCTVSLLRVKDSSVVKLGITDGSGAYSLQTDHGRYLLSISHIGYAIRYTDAFEGVGNNTMPDIILTKASTSLQGVTVSAQKPIIEVKADKTILNVEGTINAIGNDALELLRRSPGVMIDKDDNLSLAGKNGVQIYIDGKPTPLSGTDLSNYLKSMQSAQIESIEIITNPSAKYEAAGNAGIINIRLKKNKSYGANGSVSLGYVQGIYPKYNGGFNLNYRNKKVNLFGNYNYNNGLNLMSMNSHKEQFDTLFEQTNSIRFKNNTHGFKAGMDYFINAKSTIGTVISGNLADNDITTSGPMYFTYMPTNTVSRILKATSANTMTRDNVNLNLNYRYALPSGKELNIDGDYGFYKIRSNQYQPNYYYQPDGTTEINRVIYKMISPTDINIWSLKTDYEQNYKGGKLSFGGKFSLVSTDNNFNRYNVISTSDLYDTAKSNRFTYDETISALYVNYNKQLKKGIMVQFGLRGENTHSTGHSTGFAQKTSGSGYTWAAYDSVFKRDYTNLFPSGSITFNKNPMKQWTISFSRRIDRPAYQDLNPFEFKLNEYTYMKGNTQLRPQYTNSVGVTNIYKYRLTTTLNYSHVKDIFAQIPDTIDKTKGFLTKKNLANQDVVSLNISYPFQKKWYSFFATLNTNYSHYTADFGGGSRKVDQKVFALTYYMQNSFKLGKGFTAELSGLYISPSVWQGVIKSNAMGMVDGGLSKTLFKNKATLKASVSDMFSTMKWSGTSTFAGVYSTFNGHGEQPQFKLNFNYRFGNSQVKAARQRKSAVDEETKRADAGGNQGGGMGNQR